MKQALFGEFGGLHFRNRDRALSVLRNSAPNNATSFGAEQLASILCASSKIPSQILFAKVFRLVVIV